MRRTPHGEFIACKHAGEVVMNESRNSGAGASADAKTPDHATPEASSAKEGRPPPKQQPQESTRWWIKLVLQPVLLVVAAAIILAGLGVAQRAGFISAGTSRGSAHASADGQAAQYICPMMCTPPQSEPGRCPVCAMELVPVTSGGGNSDSRSIRIDPVARRVANIRTVAVKSIPMTRTIRAIGELSYDEGALRTLSAYVDGRLDRLYADYTGVVVKKGDHLALVYSPLLYTGQVELLVAKQAAEENPQAPQGRKGRLDRNLYETTRQRLIELGMTAAQIERLEESGKADSRIYLCAPISGTVIEKFVEEGQYVKEGQAIYKLADLSTVWLMLELFPEDAAMIRYGQKVEATVQSLPGRTFAGRVAFIDPNVDPKTRTVGVRVVIPNEDGVLRVGDYAKATIDVPMTASRDRQTAIYDPELAGKWISPRHPHVVESSPGKCPVCGVELVPASRFGFTAEEGASDEALVVPRDAVLMAGSNSVLYVETEPGRFEIRRVTLGPTCGDQVAVLDGVKKGEQVATRGNFLIDSQMQLAGNPSLIDPTRFEPSVEDALPAEIIAALSQLSAEDRSIAESQYICPVTMMKLGSMGRPEKVLVNGQAVFICCEGCRQRLLANPDEYLSKLADSTEESGDDAMQMELPPIGTPEPVDPEASLPPIGIPQAVHQGAASEHDSPYSPTDRAAAQSKETVR